MTSDEVDDEEEEERDEPFKAAEDGRSKVFGGEWGTGDPFVNEVRRADDEDSTGDVAVDV